MKHAVMLPLLFLISMGVIYALFAAAMNGDSTYTKVGESAPEFELTTLDGQVVKSSDLKGKVTVINFFATWCEPCRYELPLLKSRAWDRFKENERFALFVVGTGHTQEELVDYRSQESFAMPLVPDPDREIYGLFAGQSIPRNYVIDSDGKIAFQSIGYEPGEFGLMVTTVDALLRKLDKS